MQVTKVLRVLYLPLFTQNLCHTLLMFVCRMNYFTKRLENVQSVIDQHVSKHFPVIFLMDNVNLYRGNKRHLRLMKNLGPVMWNLTVRGVLIPNTSPVEHLLHEQISSEEPQKPLKDLNADDLLLVS